MIAVLGGSRKVTGSSTATPLTEPRPGIAPTNSPARQPSTIIVRLRGCRASMKPAVSGSRMVSIIAPAPSDGLAAGDAPCEGLTIDVVGDADRRGDHETCEQHRLADEA